MATRDERWRKFVEDYDIDVSESAIQSELEYIKLDMRHRMQYDQLTGGDLHLFPQRELAQQEDELRAAAVFEAKAPRVLKAIVADRGFTATHAKTYAQLLPFLCEAYSDWADDVRDGEYPEDKHGYHMDPEELEKFNEMMAKFEG